MVHISIHIFTVRFDSWEGVLSLYVIFEYLMWTWAMMMRKMTIKASWNYRMKNIAFWKIRHRIWNYERNKFMNNHVLRQKLNYYNCPHSKIINAVADPGDAAGVRPLRVQILSFWHTNLLKRSCLGSWHPPYEVGAPPREILDPLLING